MRRGPDITTIKQSLLDQIENLCFHLFPAGYRDQDEFCIGDLDGQDGQSLRIHVGRRSGKAGVWKDFATDEKGDVIDLIAQAKCGGDVGAALAWAKRWLGLDAADPAELERRREISDKQRADRERRAIEQSRKRQERALGAWLHAQKSILDTPADLYLQARGIFVRDLPRYPSALRFHPAAVTKYLDKPEPALFAIINRYDPAAGTVANVACHRTFLQADAAGRWGKHRGLKDAKLALGEYAGGFIALNRGESGKPYNQAPAGETILVSEGIEDGLTGALARPNLRTIATISVGNMANVALPPGCARVVILRQHDKEPEAILAIAAAIENFRRQGADVREATPPPAIDGKTIKDFNDELQA